MLLLCYLYCYYVIFNVIMLFFLLLCYFYCFHVIFNVVMLFLFFLMLFLFFLILFLLLLCYFDSFVPCCIVIVPTTPLFVIVQVAS